MGERLGAISSDKVIPDQDAVALRQADALPSTPRQRVSINRITPYVLTSTWQNINFGNNSPLDMNTFIDGGRYDFTNLKFIANPATSMEQQYTIQLYMKFTHKERPVTIEFRYVVPRPAEQGGDFYFPFPDTDKAVILKRISKVSSFNVAGIPIGEDTSVLTEHVTRIDLLPIGTALKAYGARLQMRTQQTITTVANRPRLTDCYLFIVPQ